MNCAQTSLAPRRDQVWSRLMMMVVRGAGPADLLSGQLLQESFEVHAADGMLKLADGFGFDLADAFAGDLEDAADLLQRVRIAVLQAVAEANDLALAPGERLEQMFDLLPQDAVIGAMDRIVAGLIFDELAKARILAVADGPVEANRMAA